MTNFDFKNAVKLSKPLKLTLVSGVALLVIGVLWLVFTPQKPQGPLLPSSSDISTHDTEKQKLNSTKSSQKNRPNSEPAAQENAASPQPEKDRENDTASDFAPNEDIEALLNESSSSSSKDSPSNTATPKKNSIDLPFYSQAPFGDWDYPWQEACEEASSLLVYNFLAQKNWTREEFNAALLELVEWEKQRFGSYEHTNVQETMQMLSEKLQLRSRVRANPSFADLMSAIDEGRLIIAPFAGRELKNPHFSGEGPVYHMLVIHGYDSAKSTVITHDVGTRHGANYEYSWAVIQNALHDWHDEDILKGTPQWIEVENQ